MRERKTKWASESEWASLDPWKLNNEEIVQRKYEKEVIKKLKYNQISTIPKRTVR